MERRMKRIFPAAAIPMLLLVLVSGCQDLNLIATIRELKYPFVPQFTSTSGPPGATVKALAVSGTTVYAGCKGGGVYKSTNSGLTWSAVGTFLPHDVVSLATDGTYLYAGAGDGTSSPNDGVYRIKLSGGSWQSYGLSETVWALLVSGGYVYAGITDDVQRIPTAGGSWLSSGSGLGTGRVYCLIEGPSAEPWAGSGAGVYRYSGGAWTQVGTVSPAYSIAYMGTTNVAVTNTSVQYWNGSAWGIYGTGQTANKKWFSIMDGSYLYICDGGGGVFRCNSAGAAWGEVGSGSDDIHSADVNALAAVSTTMLAGTGVGPGIYSHTTSAAAGAWAKSGSGIYSSTVYDLATDGTNLFAGTDRGVFARPLSGGFWADFGTGGPTDYVYDLEIAGSYLYAGGGSQVNRVLLTGGSWSTFGTGVADDIHALHSDGTYLYCGTWTGDVYQVSLATGGVWGSWGPVADSGNGANQFFEADGTLFKASNQGVRYKALAGTDWYLLGADASSFCSLTADGTYLYAGNYSTGVKRILLSGGSVWEDFGTGLPSSPIWALQVVGDRLVAGVEADGLYSVPLAGGTWQPYGAGLFDGSTVGALLLDGPTLYAGTGEFAIGGSGAWQADIVAP
jgi:hypothetical protein